MHGSVFGIPILFHWIHLSMLMPVSYFYITVTFQILQSEQCFTVQFFLELFWLILILLAFSYELQNYLVNFYKNPVGIFIEIALHLQISFGRVDILTTLSYQTKKKNCISLFLFLYFKFISTMFYSFLMQKSYTFCQINPKNLIIWMLLFLKFQFSIVHCQYMEIVFFYPSNLLIHLILAVAFYRWHQIFYIVTHVHETYK